MSFGKFWISWRQDYNSKPDKTLFRVVETVEVTVQHFVTQSMIKLTALLNFRYLGVRNMIWTHQHDKNTQQSHFIIGFNSCNSDHNSFIALAKPPNMSTYHGKYFS